MNITVKHLRQLVQIHDTPILVAIISGSRLLACHDLQNLGLVTITEGRAICTEDGNLMMNRWGNEIKDLATRLGM